MSFFTNRIEYLKKLIKSNNFLEEQHKDSFEEVLEYIDVYTLE